MSAPFTAKQHLLTLLIIIIILLYYAENKSGVAE